MDGTRRPDGGFSYETPEKGLGGGASVVASLRMPLNSDYEVRCGSFGGLSTFYSLNDGILRASSRDTEAVAGNSDGLVMAGVDRKTEVAVLLGRLVRDHEGTKDGGWGDSRGVSDGDAAAGRMIDWEDAQILDQGSSAPDIEELEAEADGQDGLVEIVGVLDEKLIYVFPGVIGRSAFRDGLLAVFMGVDVGWASGKEGGLAGVDEVGYLGGSGVDGDFDGVATGPLDSSRILGPGPLVIGKIVASGRGNGYSGLHSMMIRRSITDLGR
jgi:hypothetical protein